ncbi:MAG: site-specific integrase [Nitrospirota bacterium]|nr:site-specific integrase [Nitrospirota bacterium]
MGLTKRKNSYYVEFPVSDDGKTLTLARGAPGGKLKRWKVGTLNKTIARQQEALIKTDLMKGIVKSDQVAAPKTFSQWADDYLQIEEVRQLRSYRERRQRIEKVLTPFLGKKLLPDLTVKDVEAFRHERSVGRAQAMVNVDHNILRHMLKHAMKRDLLTRNVASLVAAPKPKNARDRVLEADEWERLSKAVPKWFQPVLVMGYHTGMRLNEILGMLWEWVDLERKRIFLPATATKTGQAREVPMTPTVARLLSALRVQAGVVRMKGLVFTKQGRRLTHTYRIMRTACQEAKIDNFVFHDLRHCAVTNLADAGVDTETIMKIVGHSSVDMFLRYRAIKADTLDAAMYRLNTLITRGREAVI